MIMAVMVLRALGLGDLLTAVPTLRALRRGLPGHHFTLAAPQPPPDGRAWSAEVIAVVSTGAYTERVPSLEEVLIDDSGSGDA